MSSTAAPSTPATGGSSSPGASSAADSSRWFVDEVHCHESHLRNYLKSAFPAVGDFDDVVQESYLRIWKSRAIQPIQSAKSFLFKVARHVALDRLRRHRNSPVQAAGDLLALSVIDDSADVVQSVSVAERFEILSEILSQLPPRSREVIILCKLQGLSHRDAAIRLGIAEKTVDEHLLRGMKRLGQTLRQQGREFLYLA